MNMAAQMRKFILLVLLFRIRRATWQLWVLVLKHSRPLLHVVHFVTSALDPCNQALSHLQIVAVLDRAQLS